MKADLRKMTGLISKGRFGMRKFHIAMRMMPRMDSQHDAEEIIPWPLNLLIHIIADDNLEGIVEEDGL